MKQASQFCALVVFLIAVPAMAGGIVTLDLESPSDGMNYRENSPVMIEWAIAASASPGDNMGLACILADLCQDGDNPQRLDLSPADAVPAEMIGFDRPAGISNPGAGYVGTQVAMDGGGMNLVQIGGGQNTFGGLPDPPVPGLAEDFEVDANIGQLSGGQIIASGSFAAPLLLGVYTFYLDSAIANTLDFVNEAPKWSPVSGATVEMGNTEGTLSFVLCIAADADGSQALTTDDIPAFADLLLGTMSADPYAMCAVDLNDDGQINGADVQTFVDAYLAG